MLQEHLPDIILLDNMSVDMMEKAVAIVSSAPKGWGLSFDVDVVDPEDMPAVGTPEAGGVRAKEMLEFFNFKLVVFFVD